MPADGEGKGRLYAPAEVLEQIVQYPWLPRQMEMTPVDDGFSLGGWEISCWQVNHGQNGYSYAYRFRRTGTSGYTIPTRLI